MIEFVKEMIIQNKFFVYHAILAMPLGRFIYILAKRKMNQKAIAIIGILIIAIMWEIFEYFYFGTSMYSWGIKGYIADTLGDILIAPTMVWSVLE